MRSSCRFAAGEKLGLKSSIWKVQIRNNDIFIFTRLFGSDCKISLHESGAGQWSLTSDYVSKHNEMKNRDRHIVRWNYERPESDQAINIFRIQIPHSELRNHPVEMIKKSVKWISGISLGTYQIDFCLTRPSEENPCDGRKNLPHKVLDTLQLANKRWLVMFYQAVGLSPDDLDKAKKTVLKQVSEMIVPITGERWIALFGYGNDGVPLIIEFHDDNLPIGESHLMS